MDEHETQKDQLALQLQMEMLKENQKIYKRLKGIDISLGIIAFVFVLYFLIFPLFGVSIKIG
ncbi:MAG: hypothetical protein II062_02200 [Oscillospiraceae bacterium]|nr:hypothetical protein [Oscillospiraceae bacterium]